MASIVTKGDVILTEDILLQLSSTQSQTSLRLALVNIKRDLQRIEFNTRSQALINALNNEMQRSINAVNLLQINFDTALINSFDDALKRENHEHEMNIIDLQHDFDKIKNNEINAENIHVVSLSNITTEFTNFNNDANNTLISIPSKLEELNVPFDTSFYQNLISVIQTQFQQLTTLFPAILQKFFDLNNRFIQKQTETEPEP